MQHGDICAQAIHVRRIAERLQITQSQIARDVGLSQPQVSRLLSGRAKRRSIAFDRVCSYVLRHVHPVSVRDVRRCIVLIDALVLVWDGSQEHAQALASVIRSLGTLGTTVKQR